MKRYEEVEKDLKIGDEIKCLVLLNKIQDTLLDTFVLDKNDDTEKLLKDYNDANTDKDYEWILMNFIIQENGLMSIY